MFTPPRAIVWLCLFVILSLFGVTTASAHFKLNLNVRIVHVDHLADGLKVYMRLPMPYLVAHLLGEAGENGLPSPAPYTSNRLEDGKLVHYVDVAQLKQSTDGLALLAGQGLSLSIDGKIVNLEVDRVNIYRNGAQPDFATLDDARQAFEKRQTFAEFEQDIYVGDTTVDALLRYTSLGAVYQYALSSGLDPGLPDQDETANLCWITAPAGYRCFERAVYCASLLWLPVRCLMRW